MDLANMRAYGVRSLAVSPDRPFVGKRSLAGRDRHPARSGPGEPEKNAGRRQLEAVTNHHSHDAASLGAERHVNADVARSLRNQVRQHPIHPNRREEERQGARTARALVCESRRNAREHSERLERQHALRRK